MHGNYQISYVKLELQHKLGIYMALFRAKIKLLVIFLTLLLITKLHNHSITNHHSICC